MRDGDRIGRWHKCHFKCLQVCHASMAAADLPCVLFWQAAVAKLQYKCLQQELDAVAGTRDNLLAVNSRRWQLMQQHQRAQEQAEVCSVCRHLLLVTDAGGSACRQMRVSCICLHTLHLCSIACCLALVYVCAGYIHLYGKDAPIKLVRETRRICSRPAAVACQQCTMTGPGALLFTALFPLGYSAAACYSAGFACRCSLGWVSRLG